MSSPAPLSPPTNIGLYWTDNELIMALDKMICGSSIPENVTTDVNPYQHKPSNLPDEIWYFVRSEPKRDSEHGFWKAKGEATEIITTPAIIGWRTTLEFYEGQAPHGQRTDWVMQEYRITEKGLHCNTHSKEVSSLCRVFLSSGANSHQPMQHKLGGAEIADRNHPKISVTPITGIASTGQGRMSESQEVAATDGHLNIPDENIFDLESILRGDYLELNDLADPESRCSSSDNSSCLTLSSDECFDSLALLRDLEYDINRDQQVKDANLRFTVAASRKPDEVVISPATLGSVVRRNGGKSPAEVTDKKLLEERVTENSSKNQTVHSGNEGASNAFNLPTSSSIDRSVVGKEKKARAGKMNNLKKKYLCFMPF